MTQKTDHITRLLDQAHQVPPSPELRRQIIAAVLLDGAPKTPASPALQQNIIAALGQRQTDNIVNFSPPIARNRSYPAALAATLTGGLMAASLLLGIWTGSSNIADSFLGPSFEIAGLALEPDEIFGSYDYTAGLDYGGDRQ